MPQFIFGLPLRTFLIRVLIFIAPGLLLLIGGPSPAAPVDHTIDTFSQAVFDALYPDSLAPLLICSVLICLPGTLFYIGADYLAEVTFARLHPTNTTPAGIWQILAYLLSLSLTAYAAYRALP